MSLITLRAVDVANVPIPQTGQTKFFVDNLNRIGIRLDSGAYVFFSGGVTGFTGLTDTPASYSGFAGKLLAVNGAETDIEFISPTAPDWQSVMAQGSSVSGIGTAALSTNGGGIGFSDDDGSAVAELSLFGVAGLFTELVYDDTSGGGGKQSILMSGTTTGQFLITDEANSQGMTYLGNYSTNFIARSITDKEYQDGHLGGKNVDALIMTPTAGQDGYVIAWDSGAGKYVLVGAGKTGIYGSSDVLLVDTTVTMTTNKLILDSTTGGLKLTSAGNITSLEIENTIGGNQFDLKPTDSANHVPISFKFGSAAQLSEIESGGTGFQFNLGTLGRVRYNSPIADNILMYLAGSATGYDLADTSGNKVHKFFTGGASAGSVVFNETGLPTGNVRMEGDTTSVLFNLLAASNNIGINVAPNAQTTFQVNGKSSGTAGRIAGWFQSTRTNGESVGVYATSASANTGDNIGLWPSVGSAGNRNMCISVLVGNPNAAVNNWVLHSASLAQSYLEGSLGVGINIPAAKVHIKGVGTTASTLGVQVEDDSGNDNFVVQDDGVVVYRGFPKLSLPSPVAGGLIRVTDDVGGDTMAWSDGSVWKRFSDGATIS